MPLVPMRDGVRLATDVHVPTDAGAGPWPVLLLRGPYGRRDPVTLVMFDVPRALERGYAVVIQDSRGRFDSEGVFAPFAPDIDDGYDTLEWVAAQAFCDGDVVMAGSSYLGATQWLAALSGHPALKAIAPALTASDYYEGWIYQGGAFQLAFNLFWALVHLAPEERRRRGLEAPSQKVPVYSTGGGDWPAANASLQVAGPWLRSADVEPLHGVGDFYFDWLANDKRDTPYWEAIGPERHPDRIGCAVLAISGWYQLFLRGAYTGYALAADGELVLGPWQNSVPGPANTSAGELDFGAAAGIDFEGVQLDFFDRVLGRSEVRPAQVRPAQVRYFTMGANEWRTAAAWPPAHVPTRWDVGPATTDFDPADPAPTLGGNTVPGVPNGPRDHREWLDREDVAAFWSEPFQGELTGPVRASVRVESSAPSFDVVALLAYEAPDGRLLNLCDGIARAHGDGEVEVDLLATSIAFAEPTRLCLLLGHANFPRFDVNPDVRETRRIVSATVELPVVPALGPLTVTVRQSAMDVFAVVLEDPNPIHLDPAAAAAAGLGDRTVNQGPANFGYVLSMLMEAFPGGEVSDLGVRLLANVFAGDRVTAAGRLEAVEHENGRTVARCAVWLDVEGGARAIEGTATVVLGEE